MYKIIELGAYVPETGEQRVRLLDSSLVKTAEDNEIQQYWNNLSNADGSAYLWVIGVSAMEYYGCNNNGDAFREDELKKAHVDFVKNAHVFLHHVNKDPEKSIGKPVYSWYNDDMHRVELILKVDKDKDGAAAIIERMKKGEQLYVSMGCFPGNMRVLMADGTKKPIDKVLPGDKVITHTGATEKVSARMRYDYSGKIYTITYEDGNTVTATEEHPFLCFPKATNVKNWVIAKELCVGDLLLSPTRAFKNEFTFKKIEHIVVEEVSIFPVYNLSVEKDESFVVEDVAVHNCSVAYDVCSICGHQSKTRAEYCDHLKFNMRKILRDGRQVYALNPNPKFFDISIVRRPADPTAFALDKIASEGGHIDDTEFTKTSAELGEEYERTQEKIAALKKVSDIIKKVDAAAVDVKDGTPVKKLLSEGFDDFDYPDFDSKLLEKEGLSPSGLVSTLFNFGSPFSFGDAMWMSGRHFFGDDFSDIHKRSMFDLLPSAFKFLSDQPSNIEKIIKSVLSDYNGELDSPKHRRIVIDIIKPVAETRITIIRRSKPSGNANIKKEASEHPVIKEQWGNFDKIHLPDGTVTTYKHLQEANHFAAVGRAGKALPKILGATLGVAALTAAVASPDLVTSMVCPLVLGLPAMALLKSSKGAVRSERSLEGFEVPADTKRMAYKYKMEKKAELPMSPYAFSTLLGMSIPGVLTLDYAYNKWKNGGDLPPAVGLERLRNDIGETTLNNPVTTLGTAALLSNLILKPGKYI